MAEYKQDAPQQFGGAFKNNDMLVSAGTTHQYTLEEVKEFAKCAKDPVYFMCTYVKIMNLDRGLMPFEMYDFQKDMVRSFHKNRFTITMCSRQVGKSTTVVGYFLHYILFNSSVRTCISANKQKTAADLLDKLKIAYENLPKFLQQGVVRWARLEVGLANGSSCFAAATSSSAVRGGSYNILLLDEFAFVAENIANQFYASTFPTITSGKTTKIIMVSTPNGMNLFHKFWVDAQAKRNDFFPIFAHWSQVPGHDEEWKQSIIRNIGGPEKFAQEYECSFLSTTMTLIRPQTLQSMVCKDPIYMGTAENGGDEGFYRFEEPQPNHQYVLMIDTGDGRGLDDSAFAIVDITKMPYHTVATYANNRITTFEYPHIILKYLKEYNMAWALVEVNDIGRDVAIILYRELEYENMLCTAADQTGQRLVFGSGFRRQLGLRMTPGSKRRGCAGMKSMIERGELLTHDYRVLQQLSTFVQKGMSYQADIGHHDDLVMPYVSFGWLVMQTNFQEITETRLLDGYKQPGQVAPEVPDIQDAPLTEEASNMIGDGADEEDRGPMPIGIMGHENMTDEGAWLIG